jgi:hypothetical protein
MTAIDHLNEQIRQLKSANTDLSGEVKQLKSQVTIVYSLAMLDDYQLVVEALRGMWRMPENTDWTKMELKHRVCIIAESMATRNRQFEHDRNNNPHSADMRESKIGLGGRRGGAE